MGNTAAGNASPPTTPVHPHTHGEHHSIIGFKNHLFGSSPHAWGTPVSDLLWHRSDRFIPTRMGNTCSKIIYFRDLPVHPHTHGEHQRPLQCDVANTGSSPHAWGTQATSTGGATPQRFIPTPMGNTTTRCLLPDRVPVHPHTHGEHGKIPMVVNHIYGSSPHAWGTRKSSSTGFAGERFIPTRMGNTSILLTPTEVRTVHPHTHGEHICTD